MNEKDYYQILQVDRQAEAEVITATYRRLAQRYHPDTSTAPDANERMQEINAAYAVLGHAERRARYDEALDDRRRQAESHAVQRYATTAPMAATKNRFLTAWQLRAPDILLETHYPVLDGRYHLDFAYPPARVAVELDAVPSRTQRHYVVHSRGPDQVLQRAGWKVLHFSERDIAKSVDSCVSMVQTAIVGQLAQPAPVAGSQTAASYAAAPAPVYTSVRPSGQGRAAYSNPNGCVVAFGSCLTTVVVVSIALASITFAIMVMLGLIQ